MNTPAQSEAYHVVFNCTVKPELVDEFMKIVTTDLVETRKEPGNLRTELMRDREQKNKFYINDIYLNKAAFDIHMGTPYFAALGGFMQKGGVLEQSMVLPESLNVVEFGTHGGPKVYKFQYFEFYGRLSAMEFMMSKANASWEKETLTIPQWGVIKAKQGGGLPVLHKGGKLYQESVPTANFVAKELGFYPEDPLLGHRCDFTVAAFTDVNNKLWDSANDKVDPQAAITKVIQEKYPVFLDKIEGGLGKMTWMAGEKLSVADFWVGAWYCDWVTNDNSPFKGLWVPIMAKYPNITRWGEAFRKENQVWLATRPQDQPY